MAALSARKLLLPTNLLCISEIFFSILSLLVFACKNQGIGYVKLIQVLNDDTITNNVNFFIGISVLTILAVVAMSFLRYFNSRLLSPLVELVINGVLGVLLSLASIVLCVALTQISTSILVQEVNLTFTNYEVTVALSFMCSVFLFGSTWYSFRKLRKRSDLPLNVSHSNADLPEDIPT